MEYMWKNTVAKLQFSPLRERAESRYFEMRFMQNAWFDFFQTLTQDARPRYQLLVQK